MTLSELEALFKDTEAGADLRRFVDIRVQRAVATYREGHPSDDGLATRLERLETAAGAKLRAAELRFHVFRECVKRGVAFELVEDISFADEAAATKKIEQLGKVAGEASTRAVNEAMASGFKPGSGSAPAARPNLRNLSPQEAIALEEAHALDDLLSR